jgi:hypothetical protein
MIHLRENAMMNKSRKIKFLSLALTAAGFVLAGGNSTPVSAQVRDPFAKPAVATAKTPGGKSSTPGMPKPEKPKPPVPTPMAAPPIQDRIAYYKRIREAAAAQNQPIPKVTSVLTLDEMSVTGIFRTPRGYAAMVEAKPIKLAYTIYPGEKFFDGQLVAIEENKLVFRKVTKWTNGKFVAAEENKPLRQYTVEQEVQGTAPVETTGKTETATTAAPVQPTEEKPKISVPTVISSPLDEMNKQLAEQPKDADAKDKLASKNKKGKTTAASEKTTDKKPVGKTEKVAKNKDQ